jgi:rubrerythrin
MLSIKDGNAVMQAFSSADEILDFAISKEDLSIQFYRDLATRVDEPHMRQLLEEFAMEEVVHKEKLLLVKTNKLLLPVEDKIFDLRVDRYATGANHSQNPNYQNALLMAMEREKVAFKMYTDLAAITEDESLSGIFTALAQEEAKHKLRIELEYEKYFPHKSE